MVSGILSKCLQHALHYKFDCSFHSRVKASPSSLPMSSSNAHNANVMPTVKNRQ